MRYFLKKHTPRVQSANLCPGRPGWFRAECFQQGRPTGHERSVGLFFQLLDGSPLCQLGRLAYFQRHLLLLLLFSKALRLSFCWGW